MSKYKKGEVLEFVCEIERTVFTSSDYKVYGAYVDINKYDFVKLNKYDNVTLTGNFHELTEGVKYNVKAIESANKYGIQYEVLNIKRDIPTGQTETATFLREILTENQASVLLKVYPDIVDRVMTNKLHDIDLNLTKGIKEKTFQIIKDKIVENFALVEVVEKYGGYGITLGMLKKLYDNYSSIEKLEEELKKDPYKSLCKISGIGFKKADGIILNLPRHVLDISEDIRSSRQRMESCMGYILEQNENDGHTKMNVSEFRNGCIELAPEGIKHFVHIIKNSEDIYLDIETKFIARKQAYVTELYIAGILKMMSENHRKYYFDYEKYGYDGDIELTDEQLQALRNLCEYNVSLLAGFAGTGKSSTTKALINMLEDNSLTYILLSPTGKASKVLSDYTDRPASTIHRGLGYNPAEGWLYNSNNKLPFDVVIVDETGMVDIYLMKHLLDAIDTDNTKLLFIQDPAQLPSVGCGNCSHDMINSKLIPTIHLTKIFRYGEGGLYNVATKIRNGEYYIPDSTKKVINFGINKDYSIIDIPQENMIEAVVNLYYSLIEQGNAIDDIMVLSHHNKGEYGTKVLNNAIQKKINPITNQKYMKYGDTIFIEGDKVLQVVNNYKSKNIFGGENPIFNGNTGIVLKVDSRSNEMIIQFDDQKIVYNKSDLEQLMLGYAVSIHRSQGDASKNVILMTPKAHTFFINRNLLYTAVTRTSKKCYHFTERDIVKSAVRKSTTQERQTFLKELLQEK